MKIYHSQPVLTWRMLSGLLLVNSILMKVWFPLADEPSIVNRGCLLEDQTNLHHHARLNAQEAIDLARQRAQQFDTQAALERKTNEALKLAKGQAHVRDDNEEQTNPNGTSLLVDCTYFAATMVSYIY